MNEHTRTRWLTVALILGVAALGVVTALKLSLKPRDADGKEMGQEAIKALDALRHAESITLHSIYPYGEYDAEDTKHGAASDPHILRGPDGKVLPGNRYGSLELSEDERDEVADAFVDLATTKGSGQSKCFWPRHELEVTSGGEKWVFTICFECRGTEVWKDKRSRYITIVLGDDDGKAQAVFDEILDKHGIWREGKSKKG
jgi:hypothetical protein